jgi:hypothetical protein
MACYPGCVLRFDGRISHAVAIYRVDFLKELCLRDDNVSIDPI